MAEIATIARPYAEAAFEAALERNSLAATGEGLAVLAAIARDERMHFLLNDPTINVEQKRELFLTVGGARLDEVSRRLLGIVVDAHREAVIGAVEEQFDELRREHERIVRARITSAQPLTEEQRGEIVRALEQRYGKKVEAEVDVDPELLGGARVQVGDQVIHASVRDALGQMAAALAR